jgi:hypothetical protein
MNRWILLGILVWGVLGWVGVKQDSWDLLQAISTWILAAGMFFAMLQAYEARRSTNAQLAAGLFQELRKEKTKKYTPLYPWPKT